MGGDNLTKFLEHFFEFLVISTLLKVLNKEVSKALLSLRSDISLLVLHDSDFFVTEVGSISSLNARVSEFSSLKLDIAEAATSIIGISLQFQGNDFTIITKMIKDILLSQIISQVFHDHIGLGVKLLVVFLMVKSDRSSTNCSVIHFIQAFISFLLSIESKETVLERFLSFVITFDHGFLDLVTFGTEGFVQFEVIKVGRQITSV